MTEFHQLLPGPAGPESRRLRRRFKLGRTHLADGLPERLVGLLGSEAELLKRLGRITSRHQAGIYGPISRADRLLNDFVLKDAVLRGGRHCVVSRHCVASLILCVTTHLGAGRTTIRLASA